MRKKELLEIIGFWRIKHDDIQKKYYELKDKYNNLILSADVKPCDDKVQEYKTEKQQLEERLAEINYQEKYPLCHHIGQTKMLFICFYIDGVHKGEEYTREKAVAYAKKNFKQKDFEIIDESEGYLDIEVTKKVKRK